MLTRNHRRSEPPHLQVNVITFTAFATGIYDVLSFSESACGYTSNARNKHLCVLIDVT